ncbi:Death effector domain-associated factor [Collichthys lucidus]|uniref:Death effector domain-associated factor n=1 Tax=Collichthys lucidus TaxID=240159 RepID=A0A4U5U9M9_COLLU|nr:Death effector domain-associated factor [Collichthys lucidus]
MGDKKSPTRPKRQAKQTADDGYWDCSVCTFRNTAEAFKCSICDVRKGTSTRFTHLLFVSHGATVSVTQLHYEVNPFVPWISSTGNPGSTPSWSPSRWLSSTRCLPRPRRSGGRGAIARTRSARTAKGSAPTVRDALRDDPRDALRDDPRDDPRDAQRDAPRDDPRDAQRASVQKRVRPEGDTPEKEKSDKEQPIKDKPDTEKDISPAITKKPSSKKTRPKSDNHQSPPSDKHSIQSGKSATKTNKNSHISRPKLKNIDRSTAQQLAITVGNVTVIITDFKEKTRSSSTSSSTITSSAGSEQQHQSSGSESMDKGSSRASTPKGDLSVGHDESF